MSLEFEVEFAEPRQNLFSVPLPLHSSQNTSPEKVPSFTCLRERKGLRWDADYCWLPLPTRQTFFQSVRHLTTNVSLALNLGPEYYSFMDFPT